MKSHAKTFLLLHWICGNQRFKIRKKQCQSFYLIFSKANGYFKKINGNKFLTLVPTNKRKDIMENTKSSEVKSEIQLGEQLKTQMILIKEYMKNEFNSDDELPLNKRIKIPDMIIIVRPALHEN